MRKYLRISSCLRNSCACLRRRCPRHMFRAVSSSISNGFALFKAIGCSTCHTPAIHSTQPSNITASLGNATVRAFSDFEIHHMGSGLADNVSQGGAGGDQFRSAPLWGLGQRIFFLHDGRTTNLMTAITAHRSNGSEATQVEENFASLSRGQQQDVLELPAFAVIAGGDARMSSRRSGRWLLFAPVLLLNGSVLGAAAGDAGAGQCNFGEGCVVQRRWLAGSVARRRCRRKRQIRQRILRSRVYHRRGLDSEIRRTAPVRKRLLRTGADRAAKCGPQALVRPIL